MGPTILPLLSALVTMLPTVIAEVVVVVVAVSRWNRHPKISMLATTAMLVMLVVEVVGRSASVLLPMRMMGEGRSTAELGMIFAVLGGVSSMVHAIALGLLAAAIFGERSPSRAQLS